MNLNNFIPLIDKEAIYKNDYLAGFLSLEIEADDFPIDIDQNVNYRIQFD